MSRDPRAATARPGARRIQMLRTPYPLAIALTLTSACAAPPQPHSTAHLPLEQVNLAAWDRLLADHVQDGYVDYPALCADRKLHSYLEQISRADLEGASRSQHLAFLINAYNAVAIGSVLEGDDPSSLLGRYRFFRRERHLVAGEAITLWDLEHERMRPLGEPRIHFARVCASSSCPRLGSEAIWPETLDAQLEDRARRFVNDPERNRFDTAKRVAHLSKIFDWYREDFEADGSSLADYLARYVADPAIAEDLLAERYKLRFTRYDWRLNGRAPAVGRSCP
jgi:hypothetical protein